MVSSVTTMASSELEHLHLAQFMESPDLIIEQISHIILPDSST